MDIGRSRVFALAAILLALISALIGYTEMRAGDPLIDWSFNFVIAVFLLASASAHWRKRSQR